MIAMRAAGQPGTGTTSADAVRQPRVDFTRQMVRQLVDGGDLRGVRVAFELLNQDARDAMAASPVAADLRAWHALAGDAAVALETIDEELAERARLLAGELRARAAFIARNPADRVALRPTSRRVLAALVESGDRGATLSGVRERTGMGATHLSNVIRALAALGFIRSETHPDDGRGRIVRATAAGRVAFGQADRQRGGPDRYESYVERAAPLAPARQGAFGYDSLHLDGAAAIPA